MEILGKSQLSLISLWGPISEDREIKENFGNPSAMNWTVPLSSLPKFMCWSPSSKCDCVWREGLFKGCAHVLNHFRHVRLFATPWTESCQSASSVLGILQARILEWVAMPSSRESSQPRDWTHISCIAGGFFFFFFLPLSHWKSPLLGVIKVKEDCKDGALMWCDCGLISKGWELSLFVYVYALTRTIHTGTQVLCFQHTQVWEHRFKFYGILLWQPKSAHIPSIISHMQRI